MGQIRGAMQFGSVRSVLDVGCSVGYIIEAAQRLGLRGAETDVSAFAVEAATARGLTARVGDLHHLPYADGEFDLVVFRHVLEHTPDPRAALAEVRRVLSPEGLALIAVPSLDYWKGRVMRRTYRSFRPDDLGRQHYVYYTGPSLHRLLSTNGFRIGAESKAFFRASLARRGPLRWAAEQLRHQALAVWQTTAVALRMRRELHFIAQKHSSAPPVEPVASVAPGMRQAAGAGRDTPGDRPLA